MWGLCHAHHKSLTAGAAKRELARQHNDPSPEHGATVNPGEFLERGLSAFSLEGRGDISSHGDSVKRQQADPAVVFIRFVVATKRCQPVPGAARMGNTDPVPTPEISPPEAAHK